LEQTIVIISVEYKTAVAKTRATATAIEKTSASVCGLLENLHKVLYKLADSVPECKSIWNPRRS
jgi:hypothetical protein